MRDEEKKGHNNKLLVEYMKLPLALETELTSCPKISPKQTLNNEIHTSSTAAPLQP